MNIPLDLWRQYLTKNMIIYCYAAPNEYEFKRRLTLAVKLAKERYDNDMINAMCKSIRSICTRNDVEFYTYMKLRGFYND